MIHPKLKAATVAAVLVAALSAIAQALGNGAPAWLGAAVAAIAAFANGYRTPADPAPQGVDPDA